MQFLSDIEINAEHSARTGLTLTSGNGLVAFNRLQRAYAAALPWPELRRSNTDKSTTAGTSSAAWPVTAPNKFLTLESVEIQDGDDLDRYKLIFQPPSVLEWNMAEREPNTAVPKYYLRDSTAVGVHQVAFRPSPKFAKTLRFTGIVEPEDAVNGNSKTVFELAAADDALTYLIAADFLDVDGFNEFADKQLQKARLILLRIFGEEAALVPEQIVRGG